MRFMLLMIPAVYQQEVPEGFVPPADAVEEMGKFNQAMIDAGVMLSGDGLHPPAKAVRVSFAGGKPLVTDGPFAEAREVVGGYWIIEVGSRDEAVAWVKKCPAFSGDVIEIRQIFGPDDFLGH
jgi:hypothetical protein